MGIVSTCPRCQSSQQFDDARSGKTVRCGQCGTFIRLPAGPSMNAAVWKPGDAVADLYEVLAVLGEGGMGTVFKVRHRLWDIELAVKSVRADKLATAGFADTFVREAETWVNLGLHPHIVSCFYVRTIDGLPRVFAEYADGGSLDQWIASGQLYEGGSGRALERVLDVAIQFAWGLAHAHGQSLVHRDVKPANVMLTRDATAKVTDFGLATAAGGEEAGWMTRQYCSPEQAARQPLTAATDIWSWAVSVLEMFFGECNWMSGLAAPEKLDEYLAEGPARQDGPRMPDGVSALLRQCFSQEPSSRPKDCVSIAQALRAIYQREVGQEHPRPEPEAAALLADSLNNRAVSLLDLGRRGETESILDRALAAEPQHLQATYNRGLLHWRDGRMADDALVQAVRAVQAPHTHSSEGHSLLAWIHLERGDRTSARAEFEQAERAGGSMERSAAQALAADDREAGVIHHFTEHQGDVRRVALAGDGRLAASAGREGTVKLWDVAAGRCLATLYGHENPAYGVALSADSRLVFSGSMEEIRVWDIASRRCLHVLRGHRDGAVWGLASTPDGRHLVSTGFDATIRIWDLATGACLRTISDHRSVVTQVAVTRDGRRAVSASQDRTLRIWDLSTGKCLRVLEGHSAPVYDVALSEDGRMALSGGNESAVLLWDLEAGACVAKLYGCHGTVTSVAIGAGAQVALTASPNDGVRLWDLPARRCVRNFREREGPWGVAVSRDGRIAVSGDTEGGVRIWNLSGHRALAPMALVRPRTGGELLTLQTRFSKRMREARAAVQAGQLGAAIGLLGQAREVPGFDRSTEVLSMWADVSRRAGRGAFRSAWQVRTLEGHDKNIVTSVALARDGRRAISAAANGSVSSWDLQSGRCERTMTDGPLIMRIATNADGSLAVTAGADDALRVWDLAAGKFLHGVATGDRKPQGRSVERRCLALTPDARIALWAGDEVIRVWDPHERKCLDTLTGHRGPITAVAISADGRVAISSSKDGTLRVWEIGSGRSVALDAHPSGAIAVALRPDGGLAVSTGDDQKLRVWDLTEKRCRAIHDLVSPVQSLALSPDGAVVVGTGGDDAALQVWDLAAGRKVAALACDAGSPLEIALSDDAQTVVTAHSLGQVCVWRLDWELVERPTAEWDEKAQPLVEAFLASHVPVGSDGLTRTGRPIFSSDDFERLLELCRYCGLGWLSPAGVRRRVEELAVARHRESVPDADAARAARLVAQMMGAVAPERRDLPAPAPTVPPATDVFRNLLRAAAGRSDAPAFGRWRLGGKTCDGEFGPVHEATDASGRRAAMHLITDGLDSSEAGSAEVLQAKQAWLDSLWAASRIGAPDIVGIVDGGITGDGTAYAALESVDHPSLSTLLQREALPLARVGAVIRQIAAALGALHRGGIAHGAVSVEHILAEPIRDSVRLTGFGIAALRRFAIEHYPPDLAGPPPMPDAPYFAPEVATGTQQSGPSADVYALGVTFYRCLAGRFPFEADHTIDLIIKIIRDPIPPLPTTADPKMKSLHGLIERMLAKRPSERPSMHEVVSALVGFGF